MSYQIHLLGGANSTRPRSGTALLPPVGGLIAEVFGGGDLPAANGERGVEASLLIWYRDTGLWTPDNDTSAGEDLTVWNRGRTCEEDATVFASQSYNPDWARDAGDVTTLEPTRGGPYGILFEGLYELDNRDAFSDDIEFLGAHELILALSRLDYADYLRVCRDPVKVPSEGPTQPEVPQSEPA